MARMCAELLPQGLRNDFAMLRLVYTSPAKVPDPGWGEGVPFATRCKAPFEVFFIDLDGLVAFQRDRVSRVWRDSPSRDRCRNAPKARGVFHCRGAAEWLGCDESPSETCDTRRGIYS
jgi:hypothetical protein